MEEIKNTVETVEETTKDVVVAPTTAVTTTEEVMNKIDEQGTAAEKAEKLCRWAAARAGVIVVAPLLGTAALIANEVYLVTRIAKVYNVKISDGAVAGFLGAVGATVAGNLLTTLIPLSIIQIPVAVGLTYAVGKVATAWIEDGMPKDMTKYKPMLEDWMNQAKTQAKEFAEDPWKNIPLGDEKKDMLKEKAEKAKETIKEKKAEVQEKSSDARAKFEEKFGEVLDKYEEKAVELREKFDAKTGSAREKIEEKTEVVREKAAEAKEKISEKAEEVKEKLAEKKDDILDKAEDVQAKVENKVEEIKDKVEK